MIAEQLKKTMKGIVLSTLLSSFIGCHTDRKLNDDFAWMTNTYNPHKNALVDIGHGKTGWYIHSREQDADVLSEGTIESFSHDGCTMKTILEPDLSATSNREINTTLSYAVDLHNIDPDSITVKTYTHYGGFDCEQYPADVRSAEHISCDHAEMTAYTRNREPLVDEQSHTVYLHLTGTEHDTYGVSKQDLIFFEFDDVGYAQQFANVFRDAVVRCGGTKGAGT